MNLYIYSQTFIS